MEALEIAKQLEIEDIVEVIKESESIFKFKDHKGTFHRKQDARVLSPAKTNMGQVSKQKLDRIVSEVVKSTKINLWKSTKMDDVLKWIMALQKKKLLNVHKVRCEKYVSFDFQ